MSIATTEPTANGSQLANQEQAKPQRLAVVDNGAFANLLDTAKYEHLWRLSSAFAASDLVPAQFQGKPANCFIGIQMAIRLGVDPFMFLQSCYVVHGRPGIEAKLAIALANASGVFVGPIRYLLEGSGKTRKCTAYATVRETGETIEMTVDWAMVEAEGWNKKSGSKWLTIPEVMFRYRAAMLLIRTHCPEVIMGMQSKEELEDSAHDMAPAARTLVAPTSLDALATRLSGEPAVESDASSVDVPADENKESDRDPFAWCKTPADVESVYQEIRSTQGGDPAEPGTDELETARVQALARVKGKK